MVGLSDVRVYLVLVNSGQTVTTTFGGCTACMTRLKHVQSPPHVSVTQPDQALDCVFLDLDLFLLYHQIDQTSNIWLLQRAEPEARTPREQGGRELVGVISNDTKPSIRGIFLHDPPQRHLGHRSHSIRFIEDNELEGTKTRGVAGFWGRGEDLFSA